MCVRYRTPEGTYFPHTPNTLRRVKLEVDYYEERCKQWMHVWRGLLFARARSCRSDVVEGFQHRLRHRAFLPEKV